VELVLGDEATHSRPGQGHELRGLPEHQRRVVIELVLCVGCDREISERPEHEHVDTRYRIVSLCDECRGKMREHDDSLERGKL
jgi:hypothetical protein